MVAGDTALRARGVRVEFQGLRAVDGVDVTLHAGEILGLIGPNGAGKTTLVNVISGFQRPSAGDVSLAGARVTGWPPQRLARRGLARTFQAVRLFAGLTTIENVEAACVGVGLSRRRARRRADESLAAFGLGHRRDVPAARLPLGEERLLGIARSLATSPRWLLLDEPAAGLDEAEGDALLTALRDTRDRIGCGLLVIDHDMRLIMRLSERIHVLSSGRTISEGTPAYVRSDPAVVAAYLGTGGEGAHAVG
jgi:ABC-type branched-subunit amino acid transport system ATPase component